MTHPQTRRLYLVRHGEAKTKDEDPERGLTDAGRVDVNRMAVWAAAKGIHVDAIQHSGKQRAAQTAEIFAQQLKVQTEAAPGLAPNDDVADIARAIERRQGNIMLVGHLPFLERLAALLTLGTADRSVVTLEAAALSELTGTDEGWQITCLMQPRFLPGT